MKAAVVSLYGNFNYGNRLQSYAVQQVLKKLGIESDVIYVKNFKRVCVQYIRNLVYKTPVHKLRKATKKQELYFKRQKSFEHFNQEYVTLRRFDAVSKIKGYDFYVLGSDQVWNPKRYNSIRKTLFFLTFTDSSKKICFSPSFGVSEIPDEWWDYFSEKLNTFPFLSVREEAGAQIIKELTGKDAEVLIDPTLMLDREEWLQIAKKPQNVDTDTKYVLTYFLGGVPQKALQDSEEISRKIDGKVYNLMDPKDESLYTCGPSEFIYLFRNADFIQTDSFHACIFALLFKKPFLLYAREGEDADMLSRIETLFKTFDIMRKYADSGLENDLFECDYEKSYERLTEEREKVYSFLKRSMDLQ